MISSFFCCVKKKGKAIHPLCNFRIEFFAYNKNANFILTSHLDGIIWDLSLIYGFELTELAHKPQSLLDLVRTGTKARIRSSMVPVTILELVQVNPFEASIFYTFFICFYCYGH
jgi:hypothetical protein